MTTLNDLEAKLRGLMDGQFSSLTLSFNDDHACNYAEAKDWPFYQEKNINGDDVLDDWVSAEERDKALASNSVWSIQWYPHTPVSFTRLMASSLEALITALPGGD